MKIILTGLIVAGVSFAQAQTPTPESVKALGQKVADWQIKTFDEHAKYRALPSNHRKEKEPENYHDLEWHNAALYVGMDQFRRIADHPQKYTDWLKMIGRRNEWKLHRRLYHADDQAVGQFYLSLYEEFRDEAMLKPTRDNFDRILANPKTGSIDWEGGEARHDRWGWCDALFMAPPLWARLAKISGEKKYLDFMDQEYRLTYDTLWDEEESFFWRDSRFRGRTERNGRKFFWARGNGWVFGGLALMIPDVPKDWERRDFYIHLFKEMAVALKASQRGDGTWSMGLLGGVEGYPIKETSGTSFFVFGLAWGINNGVLDRATYEPVVLKAWQAIAECVTEDGMLGYVQPIGAGPGQAYPDKTEVYGVGGFLAASAEVYKMVGGK